MATAGGLRVSPSSPSSSTSSPSSSPSSSSSSTSSPSSFPSSSPSSPSYPSPASSGPSLSSAALSFRTRSALCAAEGCTWPPSVSLSPSSPASGLGLRATSLLREGETVFLDRASRGWFSPLFRQGGRLASSAEFVFPAFCCHCSAPLPLRRSLLRASRKPKGGNRRRPPSEKRLPRKKGGEINNKSDEQHVDGSFKVEEAGAAGGEEETGTRQAEERHSTDTEYHSRLCVGFSPAYAELLRRAAEADNEYYLVAAKMFAGVRCLRLPASASARSPGGGDKEGEAEGRFAEAQSEHLDDARGTRPACDSPPRGNSSTEEKWKERGGERTGDRRTGGAQERTTCEECEGLGADADGCGRLSEHERKDESEEWIVPWAGWHRRPWWETMKRPHYAVSSTTEAEDEAQEEETSGDDGDGRLSPIGLSNEVAFVSSKPEQDKAKKSKVMTEGGEGKDEPEAEEPGREDEVQDDGDSEEPAKSPATKSVAGCSLESFFRAQIRKQTQDILELLSRLLPELKAAGVLTLDSFADVIGLIRMNATAYRVDHHELASLLETEATRRGKKKKKSEKKERGNDEQKERKEEYEKQEAEKTTHPEAVVERRKETKSGARRQTWTEFKKGRAKERRRGEASGSCGRGVSALHGTGNRRRESRVLEACENGTARGCGGDNRRKRKENAPCSSLCSVEGLALFPIQSCINHSCLPNCRWFYEEEREVVERRPAKEIPGDRARKRESKASGARLALAGVWCPPSEALGTEGLKPRSGEGRDTATANGDAWEPRSGQEASALLSLFPLTPSYFSLAVVACRPILPGEEITADYFRPCEARAPGARRELHAGSSLRPDVSPSFHKGETETAAIGAASVEKREATEREPRASVEAGAGRQGRASEAAGDANGEEKATKRGATPCLRVAHQQSDEQGEGGPGDRQEGRNNGGSEASGDSESPRAVEGSLELPPFLQHRYECMTHQYGFKCSCTLCRNAAAGWRLILAGALTLQDCEDFARERKLRLIEEH
ncbi:conserved hypothetical protein [Neospora caninum Liverpool]|uniref:Uncharacterized protein n=1 Tax=Neospora caninum (strain Liverpool) TaxID=572307 RepID=F0VHG7_NEOCL|nr:conserved hypothetical protein [Neospora caninum Liverpool]CBZ53161.1 conserved hypothetical protein [Neospora caninum Liverpool]|eukprot:XP_003883193.1 conserved hypothetical protein [Neospora caninum Liverpool]